MAEGQEVPPTGESVPHSGIVAPADRMPWLVFVGCVCVGLAGAVFIHLRWMVPLGGALLLFFVGWPLVGTLVTADDDLPGGWSNPDGDLRPPWLEAPFWGQIAGGLAVAAIGFAWDAGWRSRASLPCWLAALALAALALALFTRRWWLAVASTAALAAACL
jgi:hypothetical protein